MLKIIAAIISILFHAAGAILIIAPTIYIVGIYTYEWVGIGWEHEPLVPPYQVLTIGVTLGVILILIGILFRSWMGKRKN